MAAVIESRGVQGSCLKCQCDFNQVPKLLPCFHSFCKDCLYEWTDYVVVGETMSCPHCGMESVLPPDKIDGFQDDFLQGTIQDLAKVYKTNGQFCDVCKFVGDNVVSSFYCVDCGYHLCETDNKRHRATPGQRGHCVISYEGMHTGKYDKEIVSAKRENCEKHSSETPKRLSFFCKCCEDIKCEDCLVASCQYHPVTSVRGVSEGHHNEIKKTLQQIVTYKEETESMTQQLQKEMKDCKKDRNQVEGDILEYGEHLISLVERITENSKQHAISLYSKEEAKCEKIITTLTNQKKAFDNITTFVNETLEYRSDVFVLEHFKTVTENMEKCLKGMETVHCVPTKRYSFEPKEGEVIEEMLKPLIGSVSEKKDHFQNKPTPGYNTIQHNVTDSRPNSPRVEIGSLGRRVHQKSVIDQRRSKPIFVHSCLYATAGATDVSTWSNNDVIVSSSKGFQLFDSDGELKTSRSMDHKELIWNVVPCQSNLFVTVRTGNRGIAIFDQNLIKTGFHSLPGEEEFNGSLALAIDEKRNIAYICSSSTNKIYKCTLPNFEMKTFIEDGLSNPYYMCVTNEGYLVVSNRETCTVTTFDDKGHLKWIYGSKGAGRDQLDFPRDVCVDEWENVYVADFNNHRIHVLNQYGQFCKFVESTGFTFPCALHYSNRKLYVTCQQPNRLHVLNCVHS